MAPLLCPIYHSNFFNAVPHFKDQAPKLDSLDIPSILKQMEPIFRKHGTQEQFGLVLAHRNFVLGTREIMVDLDSSTGSKSVAIPWTFNPQDHGAKIPPKYMDYLISQGLDPTSVLSIQPTTWAFDCFGVLVPFEFAASRQLPKAQQLSPDFRFAAQLWAALKNTGVEKLFGIRTRNGQNFWEVTDNENREKITTYGLPPPELKGSMTPIFWCLNEKDQEWVSMGVRAC